MDADCCILQHLLLLKVTLIHGVLSILPPKTDTSQEKLEVRQVNQAILMWDSLRRTLIVDQRKLAHWFIDCLRICTRGIIAWEYGVVHLLRLRVFVFIDLSNVDLSVDRCQRHSKLKTFLLSWPFAPRSAFALVFHLIYHVLCSKWSRIKGILLSYNHILGRMGPLQSFHSLILNCAGIGGCWDHSRKLWRIARTLMIPAWDHNLAHHIFN